MVGVTVSPSDYLQMLIGRTLVYSRNVCGLVMSIVVLFGDYKINIGSKANSL